jgi:hypothetical protein
VLEGCISRPGCDDETECDDSFFCNGLERCDLESETCAPGAVPDLDDELDCTIDRCNETLVMVVHTPVSARCSDGAFCNGAELCHPADGCIAGAPPLLGDGLACTVDRCNEAIDFVEHFPDHELCDNDEFCDGVEFCHAVEGCSSGEPPLLLDGVGCTVDTCSEVLGEVIHTPSDERCQDGLFCNGEERCDLELDCQAGSAADPNDDIPCTLDSCEEGDDLTDDIGAIINTPDHDVCQNGLFCDGREICDLELGCRSGPEPDPSDEVACTVDSCEEGDDETDNLGAFIHSLGHESCQDGLFCNGEESCHRVNDCSAGTPPDASDEVDCTIDRCDEGADETDNVGRFTHTPDDGFCLNGLFCDGPERCDLLLDCRDGIPPDPSEGVNCTVDRCVEGDDFTDNAGSFTHTPDDDFCQNGLYCDGRELCHDVLDCRSGTPPDPNDDVSCTSDTCDEGADLTDNVGTLANQLDHDFCQDGRYCNGAETCHPVFDCLEGVPPDPDDSVDCTVDECDEGADPTDNVGSFVNTPDNAFCQNGLFCDGLEFCHPLLDCQSGSPPDPADGVGCTVDTCNEGADLTDNTGTFVNTPDSAACLDGRYCNGTETCHVTLDCQAGTSPDPSDGVDCTIDACDEGADLADNAGTFVNTPDSAFCQNGLYCDGAETCHVTLDCQAGGPVDPSDGIDCTIDSCDEGADLTDDVGVIVNTPDDVFCQNGLFCDGPEVCSVTLDCQAGTPPNSSDGVDCTLDTCDEDVDLTDNLGTFMHSLGHESCRDGLFCNGEESCHPVNDCSAGTSPDASDEVDCTIDLCGEGADETDNVGYFTHTPDDGFCLNGLFCDGPEWCDLLLDCRDGTPPDPSEGVNCTVDRCVEGDDLTDDVGSFTHTADDDFCQNGLFCDGRELCHDVLDCRSGTPPDPNDDVSCTSDTCDEGADLTDNVGTLANQLDHDFCQDGRYCNGAETCHPVFDCLEGVPPDPDDSVDCTVDECDEGADPTDNVGFFVNTPDGAFCQNGLFCDGAEICHLLFDCQSGSPPDPTDSVACTADTCDEGVDLTDDVGTVLNTPDHSACLDGRYCNGAETCHALLGCQDGTPPDLSDGVDCTVDTCDEGADLTDDIGSPINTPDDAFCQNGLYCDGAETCHVTLDCQAGGPVDPSDGVDCTIDSCDEGADLTDDVGVFVNTPDDAFCQNGLYCDGSEVCSVTLDCQAGTPPNSSDGVDCTVDTCDEDVDLTDNLGTIGHTADDSFCDDLEVCNGIETCSASLDCQAGTPGVDGTFCGNPPRQVCLNQICQISACGDAYRDAVIGEECDDGDTDNGDGCNACCLNEPLTIDYNGLFSAVPTVSYACQDFLGNTVVDYTISFLAFADTTGKLIVTGAPVNMEQDPPPVDENFAVRGQRTGGCTETYSLTGRFCDNNQWSGFYQQEFLGFDCLFTNCANKVWPVGGTRQ